MKTIHSNENTLYLTKDFKERDIQRSEIQNIKI